MKTDIDSLLNV